MEFFTWMVFLRVYAHEIFKFGILIGVNTTQVQCEGHTLENLLVDQG